MIISAYFSHLVHDVLRVTEAHEVAVVHRMHLAFRIDA
jgi:hypothetical protein